MEDPKYVPLDLGEIYLPQQELSDEDIERIADRVVEKLTKARRPFRDLFSGPGVSV